MAKTETETQLNIICLESKAFYALVKEVVDRVKEEHSVPLKRWITPEETMILLNIKSKTTLQKLRDNGHIRYTQPFTKVILYDRTSIEDYLEKHSKEPFA